MNANNRSTNNRTGSIQYHGSTLNPGRRTGKTRQNWIKRQKARIRSGGSPGGQGGNSNQSTQSNARPQTRNNSNRNTSNRGGQAIVRNNSQLVSTSSKVMASPLGAYVATVLDPFYAPANKARVPSEVPFPSASVTMTYTGLITPNASGNFMAMLCPQRGDSASGRFVATLAAPDFTIDTAFVSAQAATQFGYRTDYLAAGLGLRIRTVGAGIKAWYVGKDNDRSGYFCSAFLPKAATRLGNGYVCAGYTEDQLREAQYCTTSSNKTVAEVIYVPRDDVDFDYMAMDGNRETSVCVIQGFGFPATACIKWEAVIHCEFIPDPTAAGARLLSTDISTVDKAEAAAVLGSVIQDVPQYVASPEDSSNLWDTISRVGRSALDESIHIVGGIARDYVSKSLYGNLGMGGLEMIESAYF